MTARDTKAEQTEFVRVPTEPTRDMRIAGIAATDVEISASAVSMIYRAMLAAAPAAADAEPVAWWCVVSIPNGPREKMEFSAEKYAREYVERGRTEHGYAFKPDDADVFPVYRHPPTPEPRATPEYGCWKCGGSGTEQDFDHEREPCCACNGTGKVPEPRATEGKDAIANCAALEKITAEYIVRNGTDRHSHALEQLASKMLPADPRPGRGSPVAADPAPAPLTKLLDGAAIYLTGASYSHADPAMRAQVKSYARAVQQASKHYAKTAGGGK